MLLPQQPAALQAVFENNPPCVFFIFKQRWKGDYLSFKFQKLENTELTFLWKHTLVSWIACSVLQALAAERWAGWVVPVYIPAHGHRASHSWDPGRLYEAGSADCSPWPELISKCRPSLLLHFALPCAHWTFCFWWLSTVPLPHAQPDPPDLSGCISHCAEASVLWETS